MASPAAATLIPEALMEWIDLPLRRVGLCVTALRPVTGQTITSKERRHDRSR